MKQLILVLFILISLTPKVTGQDKLEWSETLKLTVDDFKGLPPEPPAHQSLILSFRLESNLKKEDIESLKTSKTFNSRVTNSFSRYHSWIDRTEASRLRYAITLFDLNEWMTRELRRRFDENRDMVLAGYYQIIQEDVRKEFDKIRQDYNNESNSGNNPAGQTNWELRISEGILALGIYCKTCEPKKE